MPNSSGSSRRSSAGPGARVSSRVSPRAVVAGASLALAAVPFGLILLLVARGWAPLLKADRGVLDGLHGYASTHPRFVAAMQLISDSGSARVWLGVLAAVVGWLLWRRLPRLAMFVVITGAGSALLNTSVKRSVHRTRPITTDPVAYATGLSFPSAHAQAAIVGYTLLLLVLVPVMHGAWRRTVITLAVLMILAIGFSRVALGVHYPSDVFGGLVLGAAWVAAMAAAFNVVPGPSGNDRVRPTGPRPMT